MPQKKTSPDHLLAPEQFPGLNEAFYATKPWEYFSTRMHLLILAAGAPDELQAIAQKGVSYGGLTYQGDKGDADQTEGLEKYVMAESEVLLHHASETLLRLYLAHESLSDCPWLEVARTRSPGDFKKKVEERFLGDLPRDERRGRAARVFFGTDDRKNLKPSPAEEDWNKGLDNIESFLVHFARHFTEADVYNALKHGLAVRPGEAAFQFDDGKLLKASGASIEYLSLRRNNGDRLRWSRSTTWIRPDHSMGFVYLAARLMKSLWQIAKLRYLNEMPSDIDLWVKPSYEEFANRLEKDEGAAIFVDSMHAELVYYTDPEEPEDPKAAAV